MTEQLLEAGVLMAVGMTVVFAFLTLLIGGIHSIAWVAKVFPETQSNAHAKYSNKGNQQASHNNKKTAPTTINPNLVAAITAAVHTHRREKK